MPRTGRPPKPIEQKRLTGNPGKRPLPAPIVALRPAIPSPTSLPPSFDTGEELIRHLVAEGADRWIGQTDAGMLRLVLDDWNMRARLLAFVDEHGVSYQSESKVSGVQYHQWPEVTLLTKVEERLDKRMAALGLDTSSRGRLGVAEIRAQTKLELLMASRPRVTGSATG